MKYNGLFIFALTAFLPLCADGVYTFGGKNGWRDAQAITGLEKGVGRYGNECLQLKSKSSTVEQNTDLLLDFEKGEIVDRAGNYAVVSNKLYSSSQAVRGTKSAQSRRKGGLSLIGKEGSFFGTQGVTGSFVIDFWIKPDVVDDGEVLVNWRSSRTRLDRIDYQLFHVGFMQNHLCIVFTNIFSSAFSALEDVELKGSSVLIPGVWSRHTILFDEESGLLEYRMNGLLEDVRYITHTGHEGGVVYPAFIGVPGSLEISSEYTGYIDDFQITRSFTHIKKELDSKRMDAMERSRYDSVGGVFVSKPIEVPTGTKIEDVKAVFDTPGQTNVKLYIRGGDNYFVRNKDNPAWQIVEDGEEIKMGFVKYFQLAAELFPNGSGDVTPSLSEVQVNYSTVSPPLPPRTVSAKAGDGKVELTWSYSVDDNIGGYYIYYGTKSGEYISRVALEGDSPIDAEKQNRFTLSGLKNNNIYYFAVASYSAFDKKIVGPLSREVFARPSNY